MKLKEQAARTLGNDSHLKNVLFPRNLMESDLRACIPHGHDVVFKIGRTQALLFAEPDNAAHALQSVAWYLMWMGNNRVKVRIHLVHPIGSGNENTVRLAYYLGYRIESIHRNFVYHPFRVRDWADEEWISDLLAVARLIVREDLHESET